MAYFKDAFLFLTLFTRGKRGKDRIYMFVLAEYMQFLLMLGFAAIFFWALVAKTAVAPQPMAFSTAFYFSAAHFLPSGTESCTEWLQTGRRKRG